MKELLIELDACQESRDWAGDKTWKEIYNTCHRGDWLLWLFTHTNPRNKRLRVLAAAHCANTVRHLMRDERSKNAIDVAIKYGEGNATIKQLNDAYADADAAAYADADAAADAAYAAAAADAAYAAYAAADAAAAAYADAAYADAAADAADAAADAAYDAAPEIKINLLKVLTDLI